MSGRRFEGVLLWCQMDVQLRRRRGQPGTVNVVKRYCKGTSHFGIGIELTTKLGDARKHSSYKSLIVLAICRLAFSHNHLLAADPLRCSRILYSCRHRPKPSLDSPRIRALYLTMKNMRKIKRFWFQEAFVHTALAERCRCWGVTGRHSRVVQNY